MSNEPDIFELEAELRAARQMLINAENAQHPSIEAERLLELRDSAHRAWVKLEEAKKRLGLN